MIDKDKLDGYLANVKTQELLPERKKEYVDMFMKVLSDHFLDYYYKMDHVGDWNLLDYQELHEVNIVTKGFFKKIEGIELILTETELFVPMTEGSFMNLRRRFYDVENKPRYHIDDNGLLLDVPIKMLNPRDNKERTYHHHFINMK